MMANMIDDRTSGTGEAVTRARLRYRTKFLLACFVFGTAIGGVIGWQAASSDTGLDIGRLTLTPIVAVLLAIALLVGLVAVPAFMFRKVDELKVRQNLQAMAAGWFALIGGYPAWQMLAAGGLVPQPSAVGLFLLGYAVTLAAFIIVKLKA